MAFLAFYEIFLPSAYVLNHCAFMLLFHSKLPVSDQEVLNLILLSADSFSSALQVESSQGEGRKENFLTSFLVD